MYYTRVVIILFRMVLCKSAFYTCSFGKTRFLSLCVLVFCVSLSFYYLFYYLFLYLFLKTFSFALCSELNVFLKDLRFGILELRNRVAKPKFL